MNKIKIFDKEAAVKTTRQKRGLTWFSDLKVSKPDCNMFHTPS